MAFHDIRFPANLSFGALGGPERRTEIVTLVSGHEERNAPWAQSRRRYDAALGLRSLDDVAALVAFFEARAGQLHGFRWKDWADFTSALPSAAVTPFDQEIGVADGLTRVFGLVKHYRSGPSGYVRPITKPVAGSVVIAVGSDPLQEGIDFIVDSLTGQVTLARPPAGGAVVTAGFAFDVPVRFDTGQIITSVAAFRAGQMPDVPVIELREAARVLVLPDWPPVAQPALSGFDAEEVPSTDPDPTNPDPADPPDTGEDPADPATDPEENAP